MNLETVFYGAIVAGGLIATYKILRFLLKAEKNDEINPVISEATFEGCSGAGEVFLSPPESLAALKKAILAETLLFEYPPAVSLWHREIIARDMGEPYRSIIAELLTILCDEGGNVSSVASTFRSSNSSTYSRVGKTSLLDHSLHVAQLFCNQGFGSYITTLGVIAALGHDLGKLPNRRTGRYYSCEHPDRSVQIVRPLLEKYLDRPDGLPALSRNELIEILGAIERHHENGDGLLLSRLRKADMAARHEEEIAAALHDETHTL